MKFTKSVAKAGRLVCHTVRKFVVSTVKKMSRSVRGAYGGDGKGRGYNRGGGRGGGAQRPLETRMSDLTLGEVDNDGCQEIHIVSNHFQMRYTGAPEKEDSDFIVHQYQVEFVPEELALHLRRHFMDKAKIIFGAQYIYDGHAQLYCPNKFTETQMILTPEMQESEESFKCQCTVTYVKSIPPTDPIYHQIYNLIMRKCLVGMSLDEIGRHFYDPDAAISYPDLKLELWPGDKNKVLTS